MTIHTTHNSQTRVAESGKFKKQLTLTDLTFIGLGAIFGSGWLFAASHVASIAGPAGIASWVIGGFAVLLLGIVSARLYYADCLLKPDFYRNCRRPSVCRRLVPGADPAGIQLADSAGLGGAVPAAVLFLCA